MNTETIEINSTKYLLKIHHENRNNATASIGRKSINIRLPLSMSREERFRQLLKMKQWAIEKLMESPEKFKPKASKEYQDGELLKIGSDEYKLNIDFKAKQSSSARIREGNIYLSISESLSKEMQNRHISTLISRCVARKRLPGLKQKIQELNSIHFNQQVNKIFFKNNRSNWGSCSMNNNINISTRLLFAPDDILEYVCVHELAHLIEHNHSERFWELVEKAMPDYKARVQWLKDNGDKCVF